MPKKRHVFALCQLPKVDNTRADPIIRELSIAVTQLITLGKLLTITRFDPFTTKQQCIGMRLSARVNKLAELKGSLIGK